MQRHVNDWVGTLKAAIPYLEEMEADNIHDPNVGLRRDSNLTDVLQKAKDIVKAAEDTQAMLGTQEPTFESELKSLINRFSKEGCSDTPDFILCTFLINALNIFDIATNERRRPYRWQRE